MSSPEDCSPNFQQAMKIYLEGLSEKERTKSFISICQGHGQPVTPDSIDIAVKAIKDKSSQRSKRKQKALDVFKTVVNSLRAYANIIDTFTSADPIHAATAWGVVNIVIDCAHRYFEVFSVMQDQLDRLASELARINKYESLYSESAEMRHALCNTYTAILRFWDIAWSKYLCKTYRHIIHAISSQTLMKLNLSISRIKENAEAIAKEGDLIEKERAERFREKQELEHISRWFNCPDCQEMRSFTDALFDDLRKGRSCDWLEDNSTYAAWRGSITNNDAQSGQAPIEPILWLQANPGTGKSTLSSYVIDKIPTYWPDAAVSYYIYRFDQTFEPVKIFKFLALQLFQKYLKTLDGRKCHGRRVPDSMQSLLTSMRHEGGHTEARIQDLLRLLIAELPRVYFILDGLDEERDRDKLAKLVNSLARIAEESPAKVRLWCSSQSHPTLVELRQLTTHQLLDVDKQTAAAVQDYLEREVPNLRQYITDEQKALILKKLSDRVEGNFMWAKLVMNQIVEAQNINHIDLIIQESDSIDSYYKRFFSRFMDADRELVCMLFAVVAFAKRPLKVTELTDAVAMLRSKDKRVLDRGELVFPDKLWKLLSPLIRLSKDSDLGDGTERCHLFHSTMFNFLLRHPDILYNDKFCRTRLDSLVIADACMLYLSQQRYTKPLVKRDEQWYDSEDVAISEQHFLFYSAKYWDKHLDHIDNATDELHARVEEFITSRNFITCLQIQSLWVAFQFAVFNRGQTDTQTKYFRRVFPDWFVKTERGQQLLGNYMRFVHEWKSLLSMRTGEIGRCWFGALGAHNFLSKHKGRYRTFCLHHDGEDGVPEGPIYHALSPSGDEIKVLRMSLKSNAGELTFTCEHWAQRGARAPVLTRELQTINTTEAATNWKAYVSRVKVKTTINTVTDTQSNDGVVWSMRDDRASPVAFSEDCRYLRIGAQIFALAAEGNYAPISGLDAQSSGGMQYVEEVAARGPYVVLASRKEIPLGREDDVLLDGSIHISMDMDEDGDDTVVEDISFYVLDKDGNITGDFTDLLKGNSRSSSNADPRTSDDPKGDGIHISSTIEKTDSDDDEDEESDPDESETEDPAEEYSEAHESWSECTSEGTADSQFEDEKETPWACLVGQNIASDAETSESESDSSFLSEHNQIDADSSDTDDHEETVVHEESTTGTTQVNDASDEETTGSEDLPLPRTAFFGYGQIRRDDVDDYSGWSSEDSGGPEFRHRYIARKEEKKKRATRGDSPPTQSQVFISVFDTRKEVPHRLFTFSKSLAYVLQDSLPAIHPTAPLAVWPLSTGDVLFANFENNSYFIRKLRPSTLYTRQIVMKFHFSPCGCFLHVASLEGQRKPLPRKRNHPREWERGIKLFLLVATYRLCKTDPSRHPPCLTHRVKVAIGEVDHTPEGHSDIIIYTMTWTSDALYFTYAEETQHTADTLRVFRADLFNEARAPLDCENFVHMPQETIFLPDSALQRKVYFFPSMKMNNEDGDMPARVVIGATKQAPLSSVYAKDKVSPPIVCFLKQADFGDWQKSTSCVEISKDRCVAHLDQHLEAFNSEEDCDLELYTRMG